jgi:PAS domain S-box-containing protein
MPVILLGVGNQNRRLTLQLLLKTGDYQVVEVDQYEPLVAAIDEWHPDVVLLDREILPNGNAVCRALRARMPDLSILMLVEDAPDVVEAALSAGASDVVRSPFPALELHHRLAQLIERAGVRLLRERETWYRNLFEQTSDGYFQCSAEGHLLQVSPGLARLLGFDTPEAAVQARLRLPVPASPTEAPRSLETLWMRADSFRVALRLYVHPMLDERRQLRYYEGFAIDITDIRPLEAVQGAARIQAPTELADALTDVITVINSDLDLDHVLDRIMSSVGKLIPGDTATIFLIDEQGVAVCMGAHGYTDPVLERTVRTLRVVVDQTPNLRRLMDTREPHLIEDTQLEPDWHHFPETSWIRSCINAPIVVDTLVIGFINVDSVHPRAFNPTHTATLKLFAEYAGIAIRNARLYGETRERAALLERQRQQYITQLERERERLRSLLDAIGDAVAGVLFDEQGSVQERYSNRAFAAMVGSEIDALSLFSLKPDDISDEDWQAQVVAILQWPEGVLDRRVAIRFQRRDGSVFDAELQLHRMVDVRGRVLGDVAVIRDVTAINAVDAYRARFIASAAHELRNPLSSVRTRLYLLQRQPEQAEEHLAILNQVIDQLVNLVEYMLDLSRFQAGVVTLKRSRMNLKTFLEGSVGIYQPTAGQMSVSLLKDLPQHPVYIQGDNARLNQLMANLLDNAFKHTPAGGTVTVRLSVVGEQALMQVQDSGSGIPPDHIPHLFKPFYRAANRHDSTGLGLAIVKEIVDLHGGSVDVESGIGTGTTFSVRLPLATDLNDEGEGGV